MEYDDIFINKMLDADCKCCAGIGIAPFGGDMHPFVVGFQTLPQFLIEKKKKKKEKQFWIAEIGYFSKGFFLVHFNWTWFSQSPVVG